MLIRILGITPHWHNTLHRVLRHFQLEALCAATALTSHSRANSSLSSVSAGMLLCNASHRQIVTAARVGAEADVRAGQGVVSDCLVFFFAD